MDINTLEKNLTQATQDFADSVPLRAALSLLLSILRLGLIALILFATHTCVLPLSSIADLIASFTLKLSPPDFIFKKFLNDYIIYQKF